MKKEELFDLLGEIDDKFYSEAAENEAVPQEPETVSAAGKSKGAVFRKAASTAAGALIIAAAGIGAAMLYSRAPYDSLDDDIQYCRDFITNTYPDVINSADDLSFRVLDLNFDGTDEILLTVEEYYCPVFVFEKREENPELVSLVGADVHQTLDSLDSLYPYENGDEKYYYYFFSFDNGAAMEARVAAAIMYDENGYRTEELLSYGILSYEEISVPNRKFFRKGWRVQDIVPSSFEDIGEEAFAELWGKYEMLPPISFEDFRSKDSEKLVTEEEKLYCEKYVAENIGEFDANNLTWLMLDLDFDGKSEIVTIPDGYGSIFIFEKTDGEPRFICSINNPADKTEAFPETRKLLGFGLYENEEEKYYCFCFDVSVRKSGLIKARTAEAVRKTEEGFYSEYLLSYGMLAYGDSFSEEACFFRDDFKIREITADGNCSTMSYEEFTERWGKYEKLPPVDFSDISRFPQLKQLGQYVCKYEDCVLFDPSSAKELIPDIPGGGALPNGIADAETNLAVIYPCFARARLYTEEKGGYTFDLIGEAVRTDKEKAPDTLYCSELYMLISKDGILSSSGVTARIPVEVKDVHALDINSLSSYLPLVYELKDGIVIFTAYEDVSGAGSPFFTVKDNVVYPLYGDFSALIDKDEYYPHSDFYPDIEFTADYEENTLRYGDTEYSFNFAKVGTDGETELFTAVTAPR